MNKSVLGFVVGLLLLGGIVLVYTLMGGQNTKDSETAAARVAQTRTETPPRDAAATPAPQSTGEALPDGVVPAQITLERTVANNGGYSPGGTVDVTITMRLAGTDPVRALGLQEIIPAGFSFAGVTTQERPDVSPRNGTQDALEFAWFNIPEFPLSFTYRLEVTPDASGPKELRGEAIFRTSGPELRSGVVTTALTQGDGAAGPAASPAVAPTAAAPATPATPAPPAPATPTPQPVPAGAPANTDPGKLSFARQAGAYAPGQALEVTVNLGFEGSSPLSTLSLLEQLPEGWTFAGTAGDGAPSILPSEGKGGLLAFIWMTPPSMPASFTYRVNVPEGADGAQQIRGSGVWSTGAMEQATDTVVTEVAKQ